MKVHGRCHCGEIAYEAEIDSAEVSICHCTDCQTLTGTAYRVSAPAKAGELHFLKGAPKVYLKIAESGRQRVQAFCGNCGTPIYSADPHEPKVFNVRTGTLAERGELKPSRQIWCRSALDWVDDLGGMEMHEKA